MRRIRSIIEERCSVSVDIPSSYGVTSTTGHVARDCFMNKREFLNTVARNGHNLEVVIWVRDSALNYIIYLWEIVSVEFIGIIRFFLWLQNLKL